MNSRDAGTESERVLHTERVALTCPNDWLERVDTWRFEARVPSRAQAIRMLAEIGMSMTGAATGGEIGVLTPAAAQEKAALAGAANVNQGKGAAQDDYRRE